MNSEWRDMAAYVARLEREREELRAALDKICRVAAPAGEDSCGQPMQKLRGAAIEEARRALSSGERTEGGR